MDNICFIFMGDLRYLFKSIVYIMLFRLFLYDARVNMDNDMVDILEF